MGEGGGGGKEGKREGVGGGGVEKEGGREGGREREKEGGREGGERRREGGRYKVLYRILCQGEIRFYVFLNKLCFPLACC